MKFLKFYSAIVILISFTFTVSFVSCEEDEEEIEQKISGDSSLRVVNNTSVDARIYFDDAFIGIVQDDNSRTWSAPTGSHDVCYDCGSKGRDEESYYFSYGGMVELTLYYQYSKAIGITSNKLEETDFKKR